MQHVVHAERDTLTWQLLKSNQWNYIDFVITQQKDRKMIMDVIVKRGDECNTDHQMTCKSEQSRQSSQIQTNTDSRKYDMSMMEAGS